MCHGPLWFCNDLHVLKVDPYHVEQPLKQIWSCLNDWHLFSIVGQWLLKNVIYDLWKSASPEAFYSPLFAVVHYFFDWVYLDFFLRKCFLSSPLRLIWILSKSLNLIGYHGNIKGKFSKKYSKIFSSEAIRGMKLKLCIHVYDISLYINYVFYCRCPCAFIAIAT